MNNPDVRLIPFRVENITAEQEPQPVVPQGVSAVDAPFVWQKGYKGKGVVVAILDTGIQMDHPNLKNRIIGGKNFTDDYNDESNFNDNNGHGTHVAGTIAADGTGGGVLGVAPEASLLIGKVLDAEGSGSYEGIIAGMKWARLWRGPHGERVRVISMSLGGSVGSTEMLHEIRMAVSRDILVVCAAGNEGDSNETTFEYGFPGAYNEVIEVGAVDYAGKLAYFSNDNPQVDCVAPGVDIISTYPGSQFAKLSGTSMATPHVAGALALLVQKSEADFGRKLMEPELYAQLIKNTQNLGFKKSSEGNGMVKLDRA